MQIAAIKIAEVIEAFVTTRIALQNTQKDIKQQHLKSIGNWPTSQSVGST